MTEQDNPEEKRRERRVRANWSGEVIGVSQRFFHKVNIVDVSLNGCRLSAQQIMPSGTRIMLRIHGHIGNNFSEIYCHGVVQHYFISGDIVMHGVRFIRMNDSGKALIVQALRRPLR